MADILSGLDKTQRAAYLEALFLRLMREGEDEAGGEEGSGGGERKFGRIPISIDPNSLLGRTPKGHGRRERARHHPFLRRSQQFSGVDKRLTAIPRDNKAAQDIYPQLRLQNQLRLGKGSAPTLTR